MVKSNAPLQIRLTEPVIFLKGPSTGLDFRGRPQTVRQDGQPAMVRGLLTLRLSKPTRIRSITIKLEGKARTEWPEGIGAKRMETSEENVILSDSTTFFTALREDNSRSRSTRRALSVGPGVHPGADDEQVDDDLDLYDVPQNDPGADWVNIGRRGSFSNGNGGRRREPVRSSSAMPGTHDSSSWHRDGFSRRPSFEIPSNRSSLLDVSSLSLRERGPSPAYTPTASPPRLPVALPGHLSRPSSLRQSNSSLPPSREPALSPIASAAPSASPSERGDSAEAEHRRPAHMMRSALSSDAVREEAVWEPSPSTGAHPEQIEEFAVEDDDNDEQGANGEVATPPALRPILGEPGRTTSTGEVRFQTPTQSPEQTTDDSEKDPASATLTPVPPPMASPEAIETAPEMNAAQDANATQSQPTLNTGNRAASVRTFNSAFSASSASISSSLEHSGNDAHPTNAAVQAISAATTPGQTSPVHADPPPLRHRASSDIPLSHSETSSAAPSRRPSLLSINQRIPSDLNINNMNSRPSEDNLSITRAGRTSRTGSASTIVESGQQTIASGSQPTLPPGVHARPQRAASGTPSLTSVPSLQHLRPAHSAHRDSEDSRGRKSGKFSLAATLRGLSRDVKERVQHGRHPSRSRSRMNSPTRQASFNDQHPYVNGSSSSTSVSMAMSRTGSGSVAPDSLRGSQQRHPSVQSGDDFMAPYGRGGAARESRSRERDPSSARERDGQERSRSRARGRHMGMKILTDKLGLGEHEDQGEDVHNWKEFRKGTYNYPISFPIPVNAPPTIHAEFGSVVYRLKASVVRVGALTPNLTEDMEITMIATPQEDDMEETENVIVERQWEEQMRYQITLGGKAFPIAGTIPIAIRLMPLLKCKIHRLTVALEEKTDYYAQEKKVARHETPKRFILLFVKQPDAKERIEPLLPIISDDPNAAEQSPLAELARQAALNNPPTDAFDLERDPNDSMYASLMEPTGPWHLEKDLIIPDCTSKIKFTSKHEQTNIVVGHWLKVTIRVERGDDEAIDSKGRRKQFDIIIETPIKILDCRVNPQWNSLPTYTATQRNVNAVPGVCSIHSGKANAPIGSQSRPSIVALPTPNEAPPITNAFVAPTGHILGLADAAGPIRPPHLNHSSSRDRRGTSDVPIGTPGQSTGEGGEDTLLERNIVYDRLMSGQLTETGEVPPSYGEVMADSARTTRSVSRVRDMERTSSGGGRSRDGSDSRSRSRLRG
ncbi:hypothetical protein CI109_104682 [Kwoniella shandongensis]|uniref:Uncharacterized protein n=1 Tax=Kwoniella shandongensis TaxID=1734106 RepID=A0A5M6BVF9_9TREE|nr:uncharacterized protein CI109_004846 [Kwoniella shandongensis]KAA5526846.1 hypothetical protein CI109_004846 [Kwoniella shandongensis]